MSQRQEGISGRRLLGRRHRPAFFMPKPTARQKPTDRPRVIDMSANSLPAAVGALLAAGVGYCACAASSLLHTSASDPAASHDFLHVYMLLVCSRHLVDDEQHAGSRSRADQEAGTSSQLGRSRVSTEPSKQGCDQGEQGELRRTKGPCPRPRGRPAADDPRVLKSVAGLDTHSQGCSWSFLAKRMRIGRFDTACRNPH